MAFAINPARRLISREKLFSGLYTLPPHIVLLAYADHQKKAAEETGRASRMIAALHEVAKTVTGTRQKMLSKPYAASFGTFAMNGVGLVPTPPKNFLST